MMEDARLTRELQYFGKGARKMAANKFATRQFEDLEILDGKGGKMCDIRVKPSGILWSPKGEHNWYRVDLGSFAKFMKEQGKRQKK